MGSLCRDRLPVGEQIGDQGRCQAAWLIGSAGLTQTRLPYRAVLRKRKPTNSAPQREPGSQTGLPVPRVPSVPTSGSGACAAAGRPQLGSAQELCPGQEPAASLPEFLQTPESRWSQQDPGSGSSRPTSGWRRGRLLPGHGQRKGAAPAQNPVGVSCPVGEQGWAVRGRGTTAW